MSNFIYIANNSQYITQSELASILSQYVSNTVFDGAIAQKVSKSGDSMSGNLVASTGGVNLGSSTGAFNSVYTSGLNLSGNISIGNNPNITGYSYEINFTELSNSSALYLADNTFTINALSSSIELVGSNIYLKNGPVYTQYNTLDDYTGNAIIEGNLKVESLSANKLIYSNTGVLTNASTSGNLSFSGGTLDTIQGIQTTSSPTFAGLTDTGLSATKLIYSNSGVLTNASTSGNLSFSGGTLDTIQGIQTTSSPTFAGLTMNGPFILNTLDADSLVFTTGSLEASSATIGNNLSFSDGKLDTIQGIQTSSSPTFTGLTLSDISNSLIYSNSSGQLENASVSGNLSFSDGSLDTISSPTFDGLTLNSLDTNSLVYTNGTLDLVSASIGSNLMFSDGTLDTIQSIGTTSSPKFYELTLSVLSNSFVCSNSLGALFNGSVSGNLSYSGGSLSFSATPSFTNITVSDLSENALVYSNGSNQLESVAIGSGLSFTGGTLSSITPTGTLLLYYGDGNIQTFGSSGPPLSSPGNVAFSAYAGSIAGISLSNSSTSSWTPSTPSTIYDTITNTGSTTIRLMVVYSVGFVVGTSGVGAFIVFMQNGFARNAITSFTGDQDYIFTGSIVYLLAPSSSFNLYYVNETLNAGVFITNNASNTEFPSLLITQI